MTSIGASLFHIINRQTEYKIHSDIRRMPVILNWVNQKNEVWLKTAGKWTKKCFNDIQGLLDSGSV